MKIVAVNDAGLRIGEDHPNAKLTDAEVERIRSMHEGGMSYEALADNFEVSKWTIGRICRYAPAVAERSGLRFGRRR